MRRGLRRERVFRDRENPLEVYDDEELRRRYRFRRETIVFLVQMIGNMLIHPTRRNHALPPLLQITIALRFLACGSFLLVVGDTLPRVSKATVCRCVRSVCVELEQLAPGFIRFPGGNRLNDVKREFFAIAGKCLRKMTTIIHVLHLYFTIMPNNRPRILYLPNSRYNL